MAYGVNAPFGLRPLCSINGGSWTDKVNEYYIYVDTNGTNSYATSIFTGDPVVINPSSANLRTGNPSLGGSITVYNPNYADGTPATFAGVGAAPILGVFVGCEYTLPSSGVNSLVKSPFWQGGTQVAPGSLIKAYVIDSPDVVYDIQVSTNIAAAGNAFVASPTFPNVNANTANTAVKAGGIGNNFALGVGGGGNFSTVVNTYTTATGNRYADNPATGNIFTGQSAFYLNVNTTTAAGADHDYNKASATLPLKVIGWTQNVNNVAAPTLTRSTTPFLNVRVLLNNHVWGHNTAATVLA